MTDLCEDRSFLCLLCNTNYCTNDRILCDPEKVRHTQGYPASNGLEQTDISGGKYNQWADLLEKALHQLKQSLLSVA